jgi:serine/threonine protein kinase
LSVSDKEKNEKYDIRCEVYSFGILLWEIAECTIPYKQLEDFEEVINGYRESFTEGTDIPEKYQSLVNEAVNQNPDHRPTFAKMLIDLQDILKNRTIEREEELSLNAVDIKRIEWNELTDITELGFGGFGSVYKARWLKDDYVVVKKLHNTNGIQKDAFQREIQMQIRAHNCNNIIRFIGITRGMVFVMLYN